MNIVEFAPEKSALYLRCRMAHENRASNCAITREIRDIDFAGKIINSVIYRAIHLATANSQSLFITSHDVIPHGMLNSTRIFISSLSAFKIHAKWESHFCRQSTIILGAECFRLFARCWQTRRVSRSSTRGLFINDLCSSRDVVWFTVLSTK